MRRRKRPATERVIIAGPNSPGTVHEKLERFVVGRNVDVLYIAHPIAQSSIEQTVVRYRREKGRLRDSTRTMRRSDLSSTSGIRYIVDVLLTLWFSLRWGRADWYVAVSPHLGALGLVLRQIGIVRRVAWWTVDYWPDRFSTTLLNRLYHRLDRLLVQHADLVWSNHAIAAARADRGATVPAVRFVLVPYVLEQSEYRHRVGPPVTRPSIVYTGMLDAQYGVDLLIRAMPTVMRSVPGASLTITSYELVTEQLVALVQDLSLAECVRFLGYIENRDAFRDVLDQAWVGAAPYRAGGWKDNVSPGKPLTYMARSLPVVMTRVTDIADEIATRGAGVLVEPEPDAIAMGLVSLLTDSARLAAASEAAFLLAGEYSAETVFGTLLERMALARYNCGRTSSPS